jgi:hypothetical protein
MAHASWYPLACREEILQVVGGRQFTFSLLVHSDAASPLVEFSASSSVLQVRSDCAPKQLVDFLLSDSASQADEVSWDTRQGTEEAGHGGEEGGIVGALTGWIPVLSCSAGSSVCPLGQLQIRR